MNKPYAEVIGDPIGHSKSPLIHNFWLGKLGIAAEYRACHVRPVELADFFARRREDLAWLGCNVTVPHKELAALRVNALLPGYLDIGAINVVVPRTDNLTGSRVLLGANTDIDGVAGVINEYHGQMMNFGVDTNRKFNVGIIGAGGAAKAASAVASMLPWIGELRIAVRRPGAGRAMLDQLNIAGKEIGITDRDLASLDILINASTMGMGDTGDSTLTLAGLGAGDVKPLVFDMVYHPLQTGLLRAAKQRDHNCANGLQMLIIQARTAFEHFFGRPAPREHDAELRGLLTS